MTGAPRQEPLAASRDSLLTRHPRTQRTIAGLVSITPEPPLPLDRKMPSPPHHSPPANAHAARLAVAAAVANESSLEAPSGVVSPAHAPGNSPSIELAWRVVHAAETRKAALLEQRAYALRVRRTIPAPGGLNTTFPSHKSGGMSPHFREERGEQGGLRPPLPYGACSPLTLTARHHSPGFPLLQVSSWLRDDSAAQPDVLQRAGTQICHMPGDPADSSPFSAALLERSAVMRKRRPKHPQRVVIQQQAPEEEEASGENFSVSGIRLETQTRGVPTAPGAADFEALKAKKAFGVMSIHAPPAARAPDWTRHGDPRALAEALTIALGQLQESYETEDEEEGETELRSSRTPELEALDAVPRPDFTDWDRTGYPENPVGTRPRARHAPPARDRNASFEQGEDGREKVKSAGQERDGSPSAIWPGPKTSRRTTAGRSAPQKVSISRSKSLPEKPEKDKSDKFEKERRTNGATGAPGEVADSGYDKANQGAVTMERGGEKSTEKTSDKAPFRKAAKVGGIPSNLPKSTAAAAAGAGSVAAKVRKKHGMPRKMVLPFSYGFDDPRYWHVESTEGRICPEFLPESRA
mmetsp:Transcript_63734/g.149689  ORF Transcript_63734/g.149689 Transcript_63734/m.149689 type:complete len:581 (+) Transcript_63734:116-1858(+)